MASITHEQNGRRTIQFVAGDQKRRSIRLGKVSQRMADAVKVRVEQLVTASITGHSTDDETARWVAGLDAVMTDKLSAVGLIPKRASSTLAAFIDAYIAGRNSSKASTRTVLGHTRRCLVAHFGENKLLREISPGEATLGGRT